MHIVFKMAENAEAASEENICKKTGTKSKKDTNVRWKWDNTKTERILEVFKAYKRQKLGEGVEWDSDKVVLFEHARSALAEQWPEDFGKSEPSTPEKPVEEMSKEEYQKHVENLKAEKELIALGYRRVSNRFKTMKKNYTQDCQNDLRSGSGQLTAQFWHSCHELWGGSAATKPLDFGESSMSLCEEQLTPHDEGSEDTESSVSFIPDLAEESTSATEGSEKRVKSTKTFVDCKRKKLQKQLTKEGKQDLVLLNSQKQMELQQSMLEAMQKREEGLDTALKSMAESTALLNRTLAATMQYMMTVAQQQHVPYNPVMFQQGAAEFRPQGVPGQFPSQGHPSASQAQGAAYPSGTRSTSPFQYFDYDQVS